MGIIRALPMEQTSQIIAGIAQLVEQLICNQ